MILEYDRRKDGNHGLCLTRDFNAVGLLVGDRLEPSDKLPDVGKVYSISDFPVSLTFWRSSAEYITRHRNPLFDRALGITPNNSVTIDVLHCIYLGVMLSWCRFVIWALITRRTWVNRGTADENLELSCLAIKHELKNFYKRHRTNRPLDNLTHISTFSKKLLGDTADQKLKTKGAETWGMFLYLLWKMSTIAHKLCPLLCALYQAGLALEALIRLWKQHGRNLPAHVVQKSFDLFANFCLLTEGVEELQQPKRHLVCHLLAKLRTLGNPSQYANWLDESLNKDLKKACRTVSQCTFEKFLLLRFRETLRRVCLKRKAK